jgi:hypothetical protein
MAEAVKLRQDCGIASPQTVGILSTSYLGTDIQHAMTSHSEHPQANSRSEAIETDLYNALTDSPDITLVKNGIEILGVEVAESPHGKISYPWNPADSDAFFNQLPQLTDNLDGSDLQIRAADFFTTLDQLWDRSLQTLLVRKFATVPQSILASIAQQAGSLAKTAASQADQLIQCVQQSLPQWDLDDLQVMARPMAYAMRGQDPKGEAIAKDWASLSEVDRAKLLLEIAQYAINQVPVSDR